MNLGGMLANLRDSLTHWGRRDGGPVRVMSDASELEPLGDRPGEPPLVDVYENERELVIHADVPGGRPSDARVAWTAGRRLTLRVPTPRVPDGTLRVSEYPERDWYRSFELPRDVDGSQATCMLRDGVLTLRIPKSTAQRTRVTVRAG